MRTCEVCLESLPINHFREAPLNTEGYSKWCITCSKEYFREWSRKRRLTRPKTDCPYSPRGGYRGRRI